MMKRPPMLIVHWTDSSGCNDLWHNKGDADEFAKSGPSLCISVGHVIHAVSKKEPWITLSPDLVPETGMCGPLITIPQCAITKTEKVK